MVYESVNDNGDEETVSLASVLVCDNVVCTYIKIFQITYTAILDVLRAYSQRKLAVCTTVTQDYKLIKL